MKKSVKILGIVLILLSLCLSGCEKKRTAESVTVPVIKDEKFGNVFIEISIDDFNAKGFEYGDSVDVEFSNGYKLTDIPYYTGYYVARGMPLVISYQGEPFVKVAKGFASIWEETGITLDDTATVKLNTAGKYADIQKVYNLKYSNDRKDFASDEIFANFRELKFPTLKEKLFYRSSSPCFNKINRAYITDSLCKQNGIQYILNLSDNREEYEAEKAKEDFNSPYYDSLVEKGCVAFFKLKIDYMSDEYASSFGKGFAQMLESNTKGPIIIHCLEGKDRTGYACILIEALSGATYDEMAKDYMTTYYDFFGISEKSNKKSYDIIREQYYDEFLNTISTLVPGEKEKDIKSRDYVKISKAYFAFAGLTDSQILSLEEFIKR